MIRLENCSGVALLLLGPGLVSCRGEARALAKPEASVDAEQVTIGGIRWYVDYDAALAVLG